MKKLFGVLFSVVFLALMATATDRPIFLPKLYIHQETPKEKNSHENKSGNPSVFFQSIDENVPIAVKKVKAESLVAVRVGIPHWEDDKGMHHDFFYGAGFVPSGWDGYVLTCLHVAGSHPANWVGESYPLIVQVFDGQETFDAKMVSFNPYADLALLKVTTTSPSGKNFTSKPAPIAEKTVGDPANPLPEKFYAIFFVPDHPSVYLTLQIGPLGVVTNALNVGIIRLGILQGVVEHGFSGGPVLAPSGVVMGMITKTSPAFSYMVLVETMNAFLIESKRILEEAKAKEEKK